MTPIDLDKLMSRVFGNEIMTTQRSGQKEYASDEDAFSNFKDQGEELGLDPKIVLWVHAMKHKSGIASYLRGVKSQREDVRGRINDLIVYLFILRGMIEEEEEEEKLKAQLEAQVEEIDKATGVRSGPILTSKQGRRYEEEKSKTNQEESASP